MSKTNASLPYNIIEIDDTNNSNQTPFYDEKGKRVKLVRILFEKKWTSNGYNTIVKTLQPELVTVMDRIYDIIEKADEEISVVKRGSIQKRKDDMPDRYEKIYKIIYT